MASSVAARNARKLSSGGVTLETRFPETPLAMRGEPVLVAEALENLLDNALKHAGPFIREAHRLVESAERACPTALERVIPRGV